MNPALFDITIGNCTQIMEMSQTERVSYFTTQPSFWIPVLIGWILLAFIVFLFGFTTVGKSKRFLITIPNYFIFFVFWIIIGALTFYMIINPVWILPFI